MMDYSLFPYWATMAEPYLRGRGVSRGRRWEKLTRANGCFVIWFSPECGGVGFVAEIATKLMIACRSYFVFQMKVIGYE